jgi:predicted regulator of Ras-like GTPase activity (Roadblock/LC7/MglB family)
MQVIEEALRALRDVQGVHGSFVITTSGALLARDLPSAFDNQLFSEVGPRIARLYETFLSGGEEMDACVLRYPEHKVYLRKMSASIIGVLSAVGVNIPALRMVSNLVIRRVDPLVIGLASKPPPPTAVAVAVTAPPPALAPRPPAIPHLPPPPASSSDPWVLDSAPTNGAAPQSVIPQDGRDPAPPPNDHHVRMYRGRRVEE